MWKGTLRVEGDWGLEENLEDGSGCGMAGSLVVMSPSGVEGSHISQETLEASITEIWVPFSPQ